LSEIEGRWRESEFHFPNSGTRLFGIERFNGLAPVDEQVGHAQRENQGEDFDDHIEIEFFRIVAAKESSLTLAPVTLPVFHHARAQMFDRPDDEHDDNESEEQPEESLPAYKSLLALNAPRIMRNRNIIR